jgi:hypothetical protein
MHRVDEGRLERVEPLALAEAFDRLDLAPFGEGGQPGARFHGFASNNTVHAPTRSSRYRVRRINQSAH